MKKYIFQLIYVLIISNYGNKNMRGQILPKYLPLILQMSFACYHYGSFFMDFKQLIMHQSIPALPISPPPPPPPRQPRGICSRCQSRAGALANFIPVRGLGISIPRGNPQAFDTHVFERWMGLLGETRPLSKTGLSIRDFIYLSI